ncbi:unnamed protein product [Toxocara canis]|uniref:Cellulase n=1 Tax=Toxocara canis TaxID=6265 RepID=A0A183VB66_TOXCA|nr:unnamed protein product [Toxocara canis]
MDIFRSENAICIQKASKSGFLQLTRTSELCWFCCTYCASVLATSAAAMTNSVDAIIAQVQKEDIDQNGQYIGRAVLEDSCSEVICATPTTARSDSSGETVAANVTKYPQPFVYLYLEQSSASIRTSNVANASVKSWNDVSIYTGLSWNGVNAS